MGTAVLLAIIVIAFFGAPMFACLAALAIWGASQLQPDAPLSQAFASELVRVFRLATSGESEALSTIPLFTFMGYVLAESKAAARLVRFSRAWVGWFPGGLAIVTILVCALFTTVTGASGVTIIAVGGLIMPALLKDGYDERFSLGLVTGSGSIGLLFPPSLPLIIYGIIYGVTAQSSSGGGGGGGGGEAMVLIDFSLQRFLLAGIVPGLVLCGLVAAYSIFVAVRDKVALTPFEAKEAFRSLVAALPELAIPILMIGALAEGFPIPEAAAFTTLYVVILEVAIFRDVKLRALERVAAEAMKMVGAIFILIVAATALTDYFVKAEIPTTLAGWLEHPYRVWKWICLFTGGFTIALALALGPRKRPFLRRGIGLALAAGTAILGIGLWVYHLDAVTPTEVQSAKQWLFLLSFNLIMLIVGSVMDIFSALLVVVPLIVPAATAFGVDPYHLGVIFLLNLEVGYVHPPMGLNLFISSFRFGVPMVKLYWAIIPILVLMLLSLLIVTYVPALTPVRAKSTEAAEGPAEPVGPTVDAAPLSIVFPDGAVWTVSRCDAMEDPLDKADCLGMFKLWQRCQDLPEALDKLECEQKTLEGENWFEEPDAG